MYKELTFHKDARKKIKAGVDKVANIVKATLGPKGRYVVISKPFGSPTITKDGITVAKDITLEDHVENLGAQIAKEAAAKTVEVAGDGTTSAMVLTQAMVDIGSNYVATGSNPIDLKKGMDIAVESIVNNLNIFSEPIQGDWDKVKSIATISANNDSKIGDLITDALKEISSEGVILVDDSKSTETYIERTQGVRFHKGYMSPYFVNTAESHSVVFENPLILLTDEKIKNPQDIVDIMEMAALEQRPLLIIAEDIEAQVMEILVVNKLRTGFPIAAVKAPAFGGRRKRMLEDFAILTNGTLITKSLGLSMSDTTLEHLGTADKITVTKGDTTIISSNPNEEKLEQRIEAIKAELKTNDSEWESKQLKERLANLIGGVAILYVGAPTDSERNEMKFRIDDALQATRAALKEGIIPGAGSALMRAAAQVTVTPTFSTTDIGKGIQLVKDACTSILYSIAKNAGQEPTVVVSNVKTTRLKNEELTDLGYNAVTNEIEDLKIAGIIDPTLVVTSALTNAASAAGMILLTEATIHEPDLTQNQQYPLPPDQQM